MNFKKELCGIRRIMSEASFFERIREAAISVSSHVIVSKNSDTQASGFPYIVRCAGTDLENIKRRLAKIDDIHVEKLANEILGICHQNTGE